MSCDQQILHVTTVGVAKSFVLSLTMLALLVVAGCGGGSTSTGNNRSVQGPVAASIRGTIAVGTAPSATAVDSTNNKIYVADFGMQPTAGSLPCSPTGADVKVIDGATELPATTIGLPGVLNPVAITLNTANHTAYVAARAWGPPLFSKGCAWISDHVAAIDPSTLSTTVIYSKLTFGRLGFLGINVNHTTSNIYVTDAGTLGMANTVIIVGSNAAIPVGTKPTGVSVNATTNKIYVANSGSNDVSVIDGSTNSVLATVTDPNAVAPVAIAVNSTTNTIYVTNSQSNNLTVIDGATDLVTATIPVGTAPSGVDVNSQTNFIYVANAGNAQAADPGSITVIDGANQTTATLTDTNAKNPVAVAVNPVTNKIYVANSGSNNLTVIDGAHN